MASTNKAYPDNLAEPERLYGLKGKGYTIQNSSREILLLGILHRIVLGSKV
jgi:hypothetical protein